MDPIRAGLNNANGISTTNGPLKPTSSVSFVDRIKQVAQNVLNKIDIVYDKIGPWGLFGVVAVVIIIPSVVVPIVAANALFVSGIVSSVAALVFFGIKAVLDYRHDKFVDNKSLEKYRPLEQELANIHADIVKEKFLEKIDNSQSREELEANLKDIMGKFAAYTTKLAVPANKLLTKNYTEDCITRGYNMRVNMLEGTLKSQDNWKAKGQFFKGQLKDIQKEVESELKLVRSIIKKLEQ